MNLPLRRPSLLDRPLTKLSGETEGAFWEILRCPPSDALHPFILGPYYGWTERIAGEIQRRELPRVMVPVIFNFGTRFDIALATASASLSGATSHDSFTAGLHDRFVVTTSRGLSQCLQVNFTLLGAYRLGLDLAALSRQVVTAGDAFGVDALDLIGQLAEAVDWPLRFALLEDFICRRFTKAVMPGADLQGAVAILQRNHGVTRIGQVARQLDISQKRLIHRFQDEIGMSPKALAQLLRFHHALDRLRGDDCPSLAQLAADSGYYDQAHFNRDFKAYCGFTPTELLARRDPVVESISH